MSINTLPKIKIFNSLSTSSVVVAGGVITIQGLPPFPVEAVYSCNRECTTACVPQHTTITPVVPAAPCECPWTFKMNIRRLACGFERASDVFSRNYLFEYTNPNGDPPTPTLISTSIVAQINSDPYSMWTAVDLTGSFRLEEKDCSTMDRTCGFIVTGNSLTQVATQVGVRAILPIWQVQRNFPITPGMEFSNPVTAFCGTEYCRYYFDIRPINTVKHTHLANSYLYRRLELEIWINADDATLIANWDAELTAALTCLGDPLV